MENIENNFNLVWKNVWIVSAVIAFIFDQLIKNLLTQGIIPGFKIFSWLWIKLIFNTGVAFGFGSGYGTFVSVVAFLFFLYIIITNTKWWFFDLYSSFAVGLVLAGSFSNIVDRFRYDGGVVDYIDVSFYSVFNLADIWIFVGLLVLIWYYWKGSENLGK